MSKAFSPLTLGPLQLNNRFIRAAAFEGMCFGGNVSDELIAYHQAVAKGGTGLTTVAYAAVSAHGRSFTHQLWMRPEILPDLRRLTNAVHLEGGKISVQLGHCGDMAKFSTIHQRSWAPCGGFNLYSLSLRKKMTHQMIQEVVDDFGNAVSLAADAGFDAVEIHAGHGYLISQFLSPYTNHRRDAYGGSLTNRMRFGLEVMDRVMQIAGDKGIAVIVKMNMRDGFSGGMEREESLLFARELEKKGVQAIILSGGFVSRSPMYVMRGSMPISTLSAHAGNKLLGLMIRLFGQWMIGNLPFRPLYFLEEAQFFRKHLSLPLIYVGGVQTAQHIQDVLDKRFDGVAMARTLIEDPAFVQQLSRNTHYASPCDACNHCVAMIYDGPFACIQHSSS